MRKLDYINNLYRQTLRDITKDVSSWKAFLRGSARMYKYSFDDQVLIYAQRPGATACAEIELWNQRFNRWVNRGATGIALINEHNGHQYLRHVFDVADTHDRQNQPFSVWQKKSEYDTEIISTLENKYGELGDNSTLETALMFTAINAVEDNLSDYYENLMQNLEGSPLEHETPQEIQRLMNLLLTSSVVYTVGHRLGMGYDHLLMDSMFEPILRFNTPAALCCLGYANSDISEMILRDIEKTVKNCEKVAEENRTFDFSGESLYNDGEIKNSNTGGTDYGNDLYDAERGTDSRPDAPRAGEPAPRQVRADEAELPQEAPQGDLRTASGRGETGASSLGDRADRTGADRTDSGRDGEAERRDRADEGIEPDDVGADDEQLQSIGRGSGNPAVDLRINADSLPGCEPDVIIQALRHGNYLAHSKEDIVSFLHSETNEERKDNYVRELYTEGLFAEMFKTGTQDHIGYRATQDGLMIYDGAFLTHTAESHFSWALTRELIEALIADGNYLDEPEQKNAEQMNLFEEDLIPKKLVKPENQFAVSQEVIDSVLRLGGATEKGPLRIYGYYRRANDPEENVEYLKHEFSRDSVGLIIDGKKATASWDENGIRIAEGESVGDAKDTILLSWESVDKRIRQLLEAGQFIRQEDALQAQAVWDQDVANRVSQLYWDEFAQMPDEFKEAFIAGNTDGGRRNLAPETLLDSEKLTALLQEIRGNIPRMEEYPPRYKYHDTGYALRLAEMYERDPVDFPAADDSLLPVKHYVSQDKIDEELIGHAGNIHESNDVFSMDSYKEILPQLADPQRVKEILSMMQEVFDSEMPDGRMYEHDKELLANVRAYAEGTYNLFPGSPYRPERLGEVQLEQLAGQEKSVETEPVDVANIEGQTDVYDIHLGSEVYIGTQECTVISLDGDTVELSDGSMFPLEITKAEFLRRVAENPLNDKLKVEAEPDREEDPFDMEKDPDDLEAERAIDAYEAEFGADGYRAFPGNAPDAEENHEISILSQVHYRLKLDDISLRYDGEVLVASDNEGNVWSGEEYYKFLVNEVFVFEDGGVVGIEPELLDAFRELSEKYGVPVESSAMPAMVIVQEQEKNAAPAAAVPQGDRHDYRITDDRIGVGTPSERYRHNVDAIRLLRQLESEDRLATPEEQGILAQYVGWGGLADCFDERNAHYEELKSLLTDDEYSAARESTLTAFYTPPVVVDAIYTALGNMGFKRGNILEPSCGVGNIIGRLPESMSESKVYGVELDSISGRIARQLYQRANITISGFEKTQFPDSFFDVAVGNVPFGQYKLPDKKYDKHNFLVHDYFIAKALDKVRPGGVIAFITSSGTMDKANPAVRRYIAQRADLLGAVRLPNDTFKAAAGTEVTADVLFFQKYDSLINDDPNWVYLGKDSNGIAMNSYFADNPQMILGEMVMTSGPFGPEPTCAPYEGQELRELLNEAVSDIHAEISERESDELAGEETDNSIPADPTVRNYSFTLVNGKVS